MKVPKIKILRLERDLPIWKVAAEIGYSATVLSNIERGKQPATAEILQKLSKFYGVPLEEVSESLEVAE